MGLKYPAQILQLHTEAADDDAAVRGIKLASIAIIISISSFDTVNDGMKRSKFGRGAFSSKPASRARSTILGAMSCRRSSATSKPLPRTSPREKRCDRFDSADTRYAPFDATPGRNSGARIAFMIAQPTAAMSGLPLNVPP